VTGLSFELTAEQEQLRQLVRDFAVREAPKDVARRLEASKDFPEELASRIAEELAAASVTAAPRLTRSATRA
jgi:acyl-CoA dehydrogenase-like protein